MKEEKQNNWALVAHELEALSYDEKVNEIIHIINEGTWLDLVPYKDYIDTFFFSYPAILWLLGEIKPYSDSLSSLFIYQNMHLNDVDLLPPMIEFIRDRETAKILYKRFPSLPLHIDLWNKSMNHLGYVLWCLEEERFDVIEQFPDLLRDSVLSGKDDIVGALLEDGRFPVTYNCLQSAAFKKNITILSLLLSSSDKTIDKSKLLYSIAGCAPREIIASLLNDTDVNPTLNNNAAIRKAVMHRNKDALAILLLDSRTDPSAMDNMALIEAATRGYLDITELLLSDSRVNPKARNNYAMMETERRGHREVVDLLLKYN